MKKKLLVGSMLINILAHSQVGINNSSPASTLDVSAKNMTGKTTNVDGILIPRVDRERAQNMVGVQVSTLLYINDANTGQRTGSAINIDSTGYYYYDGTVWTKLLPTISDQVNIYNADGTLTGNRIVSQGTNTLAFTSSANNGFSINGTTFSVNTLQNVIGIGTSSPTAKIDIIGGQNVAAIRARNIENSNNTTLSNRKTLVPMMIDINGIVVKKANPVTNNPTDSYSVDAIFETPANQPVTIFNGITFGSIVNFKFLTNYSFGNSNTALVFGDLSYSQKGGWRLASNWNSSGNTASGSRPTIVGEGTDTLTFDFPNGGNLVFIHNSGNLTVTKTAGIALSINIWEGLKMR